MCQKILAILVQSMTRWFPTNYFVFKTDAWLICHVAVCPGWSQHAPHILFSLPGLRSARTVSRLTISSVRTEQSCISPHTNSSGTGLGFDNRNRLLANRGFCLKWCIKGKHYLIFNVVTNRLKNCLSERRKTYLHGMCHFLLSICS